jgi:hypothetical protein
MGSFSIPWSFLDCHSSCPKTPPAQATAQKQPSRTFAQALHSVCDIPVSQFPTPVVKGDRLSISIPEDEYIVGMGACKHNLHGRVIWPKGSPPLKVDALRSKLQSVWKDLGKWGITSLGKGFYEFVFSKLEDVQKVRSAGAWNLNPGLLKLFAWSSDFNPNIQHQTTAQVWVKIHGLSQEYWRPKILFAIVSSVGTPICLDAATSKSAFDRPFGHFARVLVDMDLRTNLRYKVLVERKGFAFFVDLEYENLPDFCDNCQIIGHDKSYCKRFPTNENIVDNGVKHLPGKKTYVVTKNPTNKQGIEEKDAESSKAVEVTVMGDKPNEEAPGEGVVDQNLEIAPVIIPPPITVPVTGVTVLEPVIVSQDSPEASEFVADTQHINVHGCQDDVSSVAEDTIPVIVQKDIEFLKNSWANLAEQEDNTNLELDASDEPFQPVVSKASKKASKRVSMAPKSPYTTRFRGGHSRGAQ